jgi:hypothetical protein
MAAEYVTIGVYLHNHDHAVSASENQRGKHLQWYLLRPVHLGAYAPRQIAAGRRSSHPPLTGKKARSPISGARERVSRVHAKAAPHALDAVYEGASQQLRLVRLRMCTH